MATIDGFNEGQFRISLGTEIARSFTVESATELTPKLGLKGGLSGLDGAGVFICVAISPSFAFRHNPSSISM